MPVGKPGRRNRVATEEDLVDGIVEHPLLTSDEMAAEAWAAMGQQDTDAALRLWQRLRQHFPERAEGYIYPVQVLWQAGRIEEAEALADEAFARFPGRSGNVRAICLDRHVAAALGRSAGLVGESPHATARAARSLYLGGACAVAVGPPRRGKGHGRGRCQALPRQSDAQAECAWVAVARHDWEEALRRWTSVVRRTCRSASDGHIGAIQATRMLGRARRGKVDRAGGLARFPDNADVMVEHVWTAVARDDWPEAASRLKAARGKLHDAGRLEDSLGWVEYRLRSELAADTRAVTPASAERGARPPPR